MKTIQSLAAAILVMASLYTGTTHAKSIASPGPAKGGNNSWIISLLPRQAKVEKMANAPALVRKGDYFVMEVTSDTYGFSTVEVLSSKNRVVRSIPVTLDKGVNRLRIGVKDLAEGVYFIRISSDQGTFTRAFDVR